MMGYGGQGRGPMEKQEILVRLFSGNKQLPTLPVLFSRLNKMLENPFISSKKIADLIMKDQAMMSKILRLSNCAIYSKRQEITNLTNAVTFLGTTIIRNLILQISVVRIFRFHDDIPGFNINTFWEHSLGAAYFTNTLVKKLNLPPSDDYYAAGLLHDIGKLAIYQFYPEKFKAIVKKQLNQGLVDYEAEEEVLGVGHQDVGRFLAEKWRFKQEITAAIRDHHKCLESMALPAAVVRISNLFTKAAALCFPWDKKAFAIIGDPAWDILAAYKNKPIDVERMTFEIYDESAYIRDSVKELLSKK
ncbi:MAG: HDOD domain-containing protein [Candidatus Aminicenantes bacterium]|nr:MAG: HDOD domain-containing protein [Candidatus Aminicenantes bacterium]